MADLRVARKGGVLDGKLAPVGLTLSGRHASRTMSNGGREVRTAERASRREGNVSIEYIKSDTIALIEQEVVLGPYGKGVSLVSLEHICELLAIEVAV